MAQLLSRSRLIVVVFLGLVAHWENLISVAQADPQAAVTRADNFLKTAKRGKFITSYVHFGARYTAHYYQETRKVVGGDGNPVPGDFALVYQFTWDNDGVTDISFLCDDKGSVYDTRVLKTNAVVQQPYTLANATIQVLGNLLIQAFKDQMSEQDLKTVQRFVDSADTEGLMEFGIAIQQAARL